MPWFDRFDTLAAARFPELEILREEPMEKHTTFRVGGPVRRFVRPGDLRTCAALLALAEEEGWPLLTLGSGSNLLAADEGLDMLAVHTAKLDGLERTGERTIRAGAGVSLARLSAFAQREGLTGLEFAHGIPGSVGGGVYMNAGAYGGELGQVISSVSSVSCPDEEFVREHLNPQFSYRHSQFQEGDEFILRASFSLKPGGRAEIKAKMDDLAQRRKSKQPLEYPSAGSTFKRPEGHFAGGLIEQCGLKGFRVGGAQVSEKHAGFVINTGGASCTDVLALIAHIQDVVYRETGIRLEPEVKIVP